MHIRGSAIRNEIPETSRDSTKDTMILQITIPQITFDHLRLFTIYFPKAISEKNDVITASFPRSNRAGMSFIQSLLRQLRVREIDFVVEKEKRHPVKASEGKARRDRESASRDIYFYR